MKHIIILGDGMADSPIAQLGGKTILQYAHTPNMDRIARQGRNGMLATVPQGFHPGSEVANLAVMGYDLPTVYEGRGVLEAASIGIDLQPGDLAMRCNLICTEGDILKNHSAGHITTEEAKELINFLQIHLGNERVHFYPGVQYRHLLVIKGGRKELSCVPPHDVPLKPWKPLLVKADIAEAQETADLVNDLIIRSQELLEAHTINSARKAAGKDPANSIWPWSPGYRPKMQTLHEMYPQINSGSAISAVDLIRGIGRLAGLDVIDVPGATGLFNTNYEGKAEAAIKALHNQDFVYLHIEAPDEAGHEGDIILKLRTVEDLDARIVAPVLNAIETQFDEPVAVAVLPDHPTPCEIRTHVAEPIPFAIYYPGIQPDEVQVYDEFAAQKGIYGVLEKDGFMQTFMSL